MKREEIQKIELNILRDIDLFCHKHKIKYSLAFGTMLGAARHKGFIPWDDDIDIVMMRNEYEKFIICAQKYQEEFQKNHIVKNVQDENYFYPFIKVINKETIVNEEGINAKFPIGIWVDIFALDYCDTEEFNSRKIIEYRKKQSTRLLRYIAKDKYYVKALARKCYLFFLDKVFRLSWRNIKNELQTVPFSGDKKYVSVFIWSTCTSGIYPAEYCEEYDVIMFENHEFSIFKEYDKILTAIYGDYMELPPVEKRVSHGLDAKYIE